VTLPVVALAGAHQGETAYIIGKGPSLARLTEDMLGPGPIIALNHAILHVRGYRAPIYSSQKDGCVAYGARHPGKPCLDGGERITAPVAPEILLVSARESPDCYADYEPRYVVDVERDFGVPFYTPSAPITAGLAILMGCAKIVFVSHDAYALGDTRTLVGGRLEQLPQEYEVNGRLADDLCRAAGIPVEWFTPERPS
jgi:hypothetical protein